MQITRTILCGVTLLGSIQFLTAMAEVKPFFGFSGKYEGQIEINGTKVPATMKLVDFQNDIRGVINTKLKFKDSQGNEWEGTSIFVKGKYGNNGAVELSFSHHQCGAIAEICHEKKTKEITTDSKFEINEEGRDYVLYKISLNGSGTDGAPFSSAKFEMEETYAAAESNPQNPFFGVWDLDLYGANSVNYADPGPLAFSQRYNISLLNKSKMNIFGQASHGGWYPLNDKIALVSADGATGMLKYRCWIYEHLVVAQGGYAFGVVRFPGQENEEFDFEAVAWGFIE